MRPKVLSAGVQSTALIGVRGDSLDGDLLDDETVRPSRLPPPSRCIAPVAARPP
jgi:hypothetical protein